MARKIIDEEVLKFYNYDLPIELKVFEEQGKNISTLTKYKWDTEDKSNLDLCDLGLVTNKLSTLARTCKNVSNSKFVIPNKKIDIPNNISIALRVLAKMCFTGSYIINYFTMIYLTYQCYLFSDKQIIEAVRLKDLIDCDYNIATKSTAELLKITEMKNIFTRLCEEYNSFITNIVE